MPSKADELIGRIEKLKDAVEAKNQAAIDTLVAEVKDLKTQLDAVSNKAAPFPVGDAKTAAGSKDLKTLITMPTAHDGVKRLQELNDVLYIGSKLLNVDPRSMKAFSEFEATAKAMDTTDIANWVPSDLSNELIDKIRVSGNVRALHPEFTMPTNPYKHPTRTGDVTAYIADEATSDTATKFTASDQTDDVITHTAKKIAARSITSVELDEDSIVSAVQSIMDDMAIAQSEGIENGFINGDNVSGHMDSDVTDAADVRRNFNGYRNVVQAGAKQDLATFNSDNVLAIRGKMGKTGVNPAKLAWVTGFSGYVKLMTLKDAAGNAIFLTGDKFTPAVNVSGELGQLTGSPVIVSEFVREDLNAVGVYDATTVDKSILLCVYRPGWRIGNRRNLTIKSSDQIYLETDQIVVVSTQRLAFTPMYDVTANYIAGLGYNF